MWNGAVGSSWKTDRKTVNVKPHITKKRGVKSRSGNYSDFNAITGSTLVARSAGTMQAVSATAASATATATNVSGSAGVTPGSNPRITRATGSDTTKPRPSPMSAHINPFDS